MGVTMWLDENDVCSIYNTKFTNNKTAAIQAIGESKSPLIEHSSVEVPNIINRRLIIIRKFIQIILLKNCLAIFKS